MVPIEKKPAKPPQIDSQKKAAELRAKLLANRPRSAASGRSNTPSKNKELPIQTKGNSQKQSKENRRPGESSQPNFQAENRSEVINRGAEADMSIRVSISSLAAYCGFSLTRFGAFEWSSNAINPQRMRNGDADCELIKAPGMSAEIENLLAEGRNAANGKQQQEQQKQSVVPKAERVSATPGPMATSAPPLVKPDDEEQQQILDANPMSSDEEGEIRGDSTQPTSVDQPLKSVESRQDTTTEAQEKIDRQLETKSAYGALKTDKPKPPKISVQGSKEARANPKVAEGSRAKPPSPKATRDNLQTAHGRAAAYDSYKPDRDVRRRNSDQERRVSGSNVHVQQESTRQLKDQLSAKEQELAELKRATVSSSRLQAPRGQAPNMRQAEARTADSIEAMLIVSSSCAVISRSTPSRTSKHMSEEFGVPLWHL